MLENASLFLENACKCLKKLDNAYKQAWKCLKMFLLMLEKSLKKLEKTWKNLKKLENAWKKLKKLEKLEKSLIMLDNALLLLRNAWWKLENA